MQEKTIDIIGGGISGMASAYYLSKHQGYKIRVWEKDDHLGGLAGSFSSDDFTVEKFYHHMFKRDKALIELIGEVGLGNDIVWKPAATGSYYFNQPYRLSSPIDVIKFKPLPFFDRFKMGWLLIMARKYKSWEELDDITAREFIIKHSGKKVWEVVWEPLFNGKFGEYSDDVSAAWLWCKLIDRGSSRDSSGHELLGFLSGGLGRMFTQIEKHLVTKGHHVQTNTPVEKLISENNRITKIVVDGKELKTDGVIAGCHTPQLASLINDFDSNYANVLNKVDYLSNVCLVLTMTKSLSEFYWTNVTDPDSPFVGVIEQSNWAGTKEFNDQHLVYISAYVSKTDDRLNKTADELLAQYHPFLLKMFPHFDPSVIVKKYVWTAPFTQPIVSVGYRKKVPSIKTPLDNLLLCTMAQIYPNDRQVSNGIQKAKETVEILTKLIQ